LIRRGVDRETTRLKGSFSLDPGMIVFEVVRETVAKIGQELEL
jgi:hypothetical protein